MPEARYLPALSTVTARKASQFTPAVYAALRTQGALHAAVA
jgi:hypothetical protein